MTNRQKLEQIAGGSCWNIYCEECPIANECHDPYKKGKAIGFADWMRAKESHFRIAAAHAKLAEMKEAPDA